MNHTRQLIAEAATTVDGIDVTPYYGTATAPGHGWVSLTRRDRDDTGLGYLNRWTVTVVCPQDLHAAELWIDNHADQLVDALSTELIVTAVVPATLVMDQGNIPGLVIEGTRAH